MGYGQNTTPVAYDPASNSLIYTVYNVGRIGTGTSAPLYSTLNLFFTSDMGENWVKDTLGSFQNEIVVAPSIGITSNGNVSSPADLNIVTYSKYCTYDNNKNPWAGAYFQVKTPSDYQSWPTVGPEKGENASFYMWPVAPLSLYKNNGNICVTAPGVLSENNALAIYGMYGQASLNATALDNYFSIPNEWAANNFWISTDATRSYNSRIFTDADNAGNVYSAVFNFCVNNDLDSVRTPAISKSTDGGNTWGTFNLCPAKIIIDYMNTNNFLRYQPAGSAYAGQLIQWSPSSFENNGFVVTGTDQYSFITSMLGETVVNDTLYYKIRMVELNYSNKTWSINTIADLPDASSIQDIYEVTDANQNRKYDTLAFSYDGYEINAAKTADGNDIVCTWIANTRKHFLNPPLQFYPSNLDSIELTDVFGAVRSLSNPAWTAVQFTDDEYCNKLTRLPKVVPNRNNVPMIAHNSEYSTKEAVWTTYPALIQNINHQTFQAFYLMNLDFSNPKKLWPAAVNDQPAINFTLNAPVPNPSNGITELTFNLQEGAFTTLSVYNTLGVKVADLQNGFTSEGIHGLNINTESYVSGVYYVVLTAGSKSASTLLNVVR
jgi:hypothetical protein